MQIAGMNISRLINSSFIPLHLLFWTGVWFFYVYFFSYNAEDTNYVTWFSSFLLPVTMLTTYFVVYYLIPKYLLMKRYGLFILYCIYTLVISTYLILMTIFASLIFLSNLNIRQMPPMSKNYVFILILVYLVVFIVSFVYLLNHNFKTESENKALQNKILETQLQIKDQELQYLKKQIHPHFLFNTLNTIYGFALKRSKTTPDIILKLSNLLDYILYQVNQPMVSLKEEMMHIQEYIALEKIRFQDTLKVSIQPLHDAGEQQIAPMLFLPFVENAFKHGQIVNGYLTVDIQIRQEKGQLQFNIKNSIKNDEDLTSRQGIGLENIKKRLDLIYPESHSLDIKSDHGWFSVSLTLFNFNPQ